MSATDLAVGPERAVAQLLETSVDLRECAILDPAGNLLACSADGSWESCGEALWKAASAPALPAPNQLHVATEEGELFAARTPAGTAIAVADRFALASLMFCDLRAALRQLEPALAATGRRT